MSNASVERVWSAHGLDCAVLFVHTGWGPGHRCGYVRVPDDHPWKGIAYNESAPGPPPSDEVLDEFNVGEDLNIIAAFDCAHLDDTPDLWTEERVAAECERLAEQLAGVAKVSADA